MDNEAVQLLDDDLDEEMGGPYYVTELSAQIDDFDEGAEEWEARLLLEPDDDTVPLERVSAPDEAVARALVFRVHFDDEDWFDRMDQHDDGLANIAEEFIDRDWVEDLDPDAVFVTGLVIVYYVEVQEDARGRKLSHQLVRAIGRAFRRDIVALRPAGGSFDEEGQFVPDATKQKGLTRHWAGMGFVPALHSDVMVLPIEARS